MSTRILNSLIADLTTWAEAPCEIAGDLARVDRYTAVHIALDARSGDLKCGPARVTHDEIDHEPGRLVLRIERSDFLAQSASAADWSAMRPTLQRALREAKSRAAA